MIPKQIHYIWFGPYEDSCIQWVNKWQDVMPEYTINKWNNETIEPYVNKAIGILGGLECTKGKTITYMSDLIRLLILKDHGGIYMDHDFILIKDFSELLIKDCILTFQYDSKYSDRVSYKEVGQLVDETLVENYADHVYSHATVNNCLMAVTKNNKVIDKAIDLFIDNHFKSTLKQFQFSNWGCGPATISNAVLSFDLDISKSTTVSNNDIIVYERSKLHPLHGAERSKLGIEEYFKLVNKIIDEQTSYAIHFHEHFGINLYIQQKLITFNEWYNSWMQNKKLV